MDNNQTKSKKKKASKKTTNVPVSNLGFTIKLNSDIIDPRNIKKKINKHKKKYVQSNSNKQHFMSRLRMVVDVNQLPNQIQNHLFKIRKKCDWNYVKKVYYRSREKVYCYICLDQNIIAPQITFCGHIYCFHCILMHFKLSSNCFSCPVCKEIIDKNQLKTCQIKYDCQIKINDEIILDLKYRQGQYIYDADTLTEDLNCAEIIRMRTKGILPIFQSQVMELKKYLNLTEKKDRIYEYLVQGLGISIQKLQSLKNIDGFTQVTLRQNQIVKNQIIYRVISQEEKKKLITFYQEKSGSLVYLHKLCKKYIDFIKDNEYEQIKSIILDKQQIDLQQDENFYKQIPILYNNLEIYAVIINIDNYTTSSKKQKYITELSQLMQARQKQNQKQEIELQRLRIQYQQDQQYMRKLKAQEQSQFYFQVKLSQNLDPCDINEHSFPSLISGKTNLLQIQQEDKKQQMIVTVAATTPTITTTIQEEQPEKQEKQQQKIKLSIMESNEQFPELSQIQSPKNQATKPLKNGKKKKKGKFINVTQQILCNNEQEQNE